MGDDDFPPTYWVVCFHEQCSQEAVEYISERLEAVDEDLPGTAGLFVTQEDMRPNGLIFHVSATRKRIYQIAEAISIKKEDKNGVIREFTRKEAEEFPESGIVGPFTLSDVHRIVAHAMESVHFSKEDTTLPGHSDAKIMKKAPMISAFRENGFIDTFPLHDDETLDRLNKKWKKSSFLKPPIEDIRDYFGENVALYFSFTSFYTAFLIPVALIGIVQFVLDRFFGVDMLYSNLAFALINLMAVTVFLDMWKRRSNEHNYFWGTGGKLRHKAPRPEYRGELRENPVTGKEEMYYPPKKTLQKMMFVSLPVTGVCLAVAFVMMLASFEADRRVIAYITDPETGEVSTSLPATILSFVPTIVYTVMILVGNLKYLHFAHHLTEWENHRTQDQFERHVVIKLVLFEFVNTFLALFYIGFYLKDVAMLKSQVFLMLLVMQIVNQLQETLIPILLRRPSARKMMNKISKKLEKEEDVKKVVEKIPVAHKMVKKLKILSKDHRHVVMANYSLKRDPYESTYDDFMELWLQFGHVFLFSSVYPLAGFFALVNNIFELRMDSYKLCKLARKPTPRASRDIGAWYMAFSITSIISVMTNCALLSMDKDVRAFKDPTSSETDWALLFVAIEHFFLFVRIVIDKLIPDVSSQVKLRIDRDEFALRHK